MPSLFTCTASTTNTKDLTFLPQQLYFETSVEVTSIKVEVLGAPAPILDLDADGVASLGKAFRTSQITNGYVLPLANGFIPNKNVTITIVTPASCTPEIFGESPDGYGDAYFITSSPKAFASSPITLDGDDFDWISFENGTPASDIVNITRPDGFVESAIKLTELKAIASREFGITNSADDYYLDNSDDSVESLTYVPNADTKLYTGVFVPAKM